MTTPEPSTLSEQELKALEEYTWSLACCVCVGPDSDGNHDDDCQAPFWQKVSRAIAQARAARSLPTCATCKWATGYEYKGRIGCEHPAVELAADQGDGMHNVFRPMRDTFGCTLHEPSPPAQDGGRP